MEGDQVENMRQKAERKRAASLKGETCGKAKLTDEQVLAIRSSSLAQRVLAKEYGISQSQVHRIKKGTQWSHI